MPPAWPCPWCSIASARVGGRGGHNPDSFLSVLIVILARPKADNFPVEVDADSPSHAHDHRRIADYFQGCSKRDTLETAGLLVPPLCRRSPNVATRRRPKFFLHVVPVCHSQ